MAGLLEACPAVSIYGVAMPIFGSLDYLSFTVNDPIFDDAFAYLKKLSQNKTSNLSEVEKLALAESRKVQLNAADFAVESLYNTCLREEAFFESHRKYIDVQFVLQGEEFIETSCITQLDVSYPYDKDSDLIKYKIPPVASRLLLQEGMGAIFFPTDGHMPGLRVNSQKPVRVMKAVVKVRAPEIGKELMG